MIKNNQLKSAYKAMVCLVEDMCDKGHIDKEKMRNFKAIYATTFKIEDNGKCIKFREDLEVHTTKNDYLTIQADFYKTKLKDEFPATIKTDICRYGIGEMFFGMIKKNDY